VSTPSDSFASEENQDTNERPPEEGTLPASNEESATETYEADQPAEPSSRDLPPEAQGDVNGGPLGCCLGITIGVLLSISVAILSYVYATPLRSIFHENLPSLTRILMVVVAILGAIICGSLGWKIGKSVYREYELSPRQKKKLAQLERKYAKNKQASLHKE
jgi:hypothetical protein